MVLQQPLRVSFWRVAERATSLMLTSSSARAGRGKPSSRAMPKISGPLIPACSLWLFEELVTPCLLRNFARGGKPAIHRSPESCDGLCFLVEEVFEETWLI